MASLDQQLQEALAAINGLTEKVQSLTSNLDILWNENQALRGQRPASAHVPFMPPPSYPSMFSPQPLPHHSPPWPSGSRPLPTPPWFSPSHIPLPQTPPAQSSFKDPKIASPLPFSGKREDMEMFIHSCILISMDIHLNLVPNKTRLPGFFHICKPVWPEHGENTSWLKSLKRLSGTNCRWTPPRNPTTI